MKASYIMTLREGLPQFKTSALQMRPTLAGSEEAPLRSFIYQDALRAATKHLGKLAEMAASAGKDSTHKFKDSNFAWSIMYFYCRPYILNQNPQNQFSQNYVTVYDENMC